MVVILGFALGTAAYTATQTHPDWLLFATKTFFFSFGYAACFFFGAKQ